MEEKTLVYKYNVDPDSNPNKKSPKLAIFDVDWTIIKPKEGRTFPKDKDDWMWLRSSVPATLQAYASTYQLVFLTDQTKDWKVEMIQHVCECLHVPITACIAMDKEYHKPNDAFFKHVFPKYSKKSFYVGDAAGRKDDWSSCDKEIAEKLQIQFYTPEEIFPMDAVQENTHQYEVDHREIILMVGMQGSGKSTFVKNKFSSKYTVISGDVYKTAERMLKEADKHSTSIIFDATHGTKEKRKRFVDYAKEKGLPLRCIWMSTNIDTCIEQNKQREAETGTHVPKIALYKYRKDFQEPEESEGFVLIKI